MEEVLRLPSTNYHMIANAIQTIMGLLSHADPLTWIAFVLTDSMVNFASKTDAFAHHHMTSSTHRKQQHLSIKYRLYSNDF